MLVLGGLLFLLNYNLPAAQSFSFSNLASLTKPLYMHAATSADPIVYTHKNEVDALEVKEAENHGVIANVIDNLEEKISVRKVEDNLDPTLEQMKDYVRQEAKQAGLNPSEVEAIINCESRWDPEAKGHNRNGSYDLGLWQINSIHKNITDAEKADYKAATKWAIEKRLRDGNWSAWVCARKLAIR